MREKKDSTRRDSAGKKWKEKEKAEDTRRHKERYIK